MTQYFDGISILAVDLVGTLVRASAPGFYTLGSEFLVKYGYEVSPDGFRKVFRKRYLEYSMGNYADDQEFYSAILSDLSKPTDSSVNALTEIYNQHCFPFEDAMPFLETLSRTYPLVLASNHVAAWARRILLSHHWHIFFREILVSSDCGFRKPSSQFFLELLKISGASCPSEVLMIGDSVVNDIYGATESGLKAVLVDRDRPGHERKLLKHVPAFVNLTDLANVLVSEERTPCVIEH
jgi:HAD superfamily hydrolase (TIGR01549 family)